MGRGVVEEVLFDGEVGDDVAIFHADDAFCMTSDVGLVGDHDDGLAVVVELLEEGEDFLAGGGVEVARGFIGEEDGGVCDECAGDSDALLLSAGELIGLVFHAVGEADGLEGGSCAFCAVPPAVAGIDEWEFDVFEGGESGHEFEGLEDKPDAFVADAGECGGVHAGGELSVEFVGA